MLKFFLIIIGIIFIAYLAIDESYNLSISAMGYEYTFSIAVVFVALVLLFYLVHLIKKPFIWFANYKTRKMQQNIQRKETFLTRVLTTVLDKNNEEASNVLSKRKKLFAKGSTEQLLFDALFAPKTSVFEQLKANKSTELAGIRGLYLEAKEKGDVATQDQLLEQGLAQYPNVLWLMQEQLELRLLQDDWNKALETLELLNKRKALSKADYIAKKSCILYKTAHLKEAFSLAPDNPIIAIAYAASDPKKAADILKKSWALTPCWETYESYKKLIKSENASKQMKLVEKFVSKNANSKLSLLAVVDIAIENNLWGVAKEMLEVAMNSYTTTAQMALMMAVIERNGWHHESAAKEWEEKAMSADHSPMWVCKDCRRTSATWDVKCPTCNACGDMMYHV